VTVALITGITGQDGSYLAELLTAKGYEVHGTVRRPADPARDDLHLADMTDGASLVRVLERIQPDEIYNLAAQSHVGDSFLTPAVTFDVDALGVVRLLDAVRLVVPTARFYQASTSELFGTSPAPQNEGTPLHPRSPYGIAKLAAYWAVRHAREAHGLHASNGILFNHESPRRGVAFVTRKIAQAVARIVRGEQTILQLGNLDARRDWGWAPEYVDAMWRMLQQPDPDDLVIATGTSFSVQDFAEHAFSAAGLDWTDHVRVDASQFRPTEVPDLVGDASLAAARIGWTATIAAPEIAARMVEAELV
jgi:GDPmannose 4,6-dehydratase